MELMDMGSYWKGLYLPAVFGSDRSQEDPRYSPLGNVCVEDPS